MTKTKIHFVCTGNTFRSRLAKAYLDSKKCENIETSSSGIRANRNLDGTICWYTQKLITENILIDFVKPTWTQTTSEILNNANIVVFMTKPHLDYCVKNFSYNPVNFEIWNIEDVGILKNDSDTIKKTQKIFSQIKLKVEEFSKKIE